MKILYLIPARGGSKGLPQKNIKPLAGKPLICYTVEEARKIAEDRDICISTDSVEIKALVEKTGLHVPFLRPDELATDEASSEAVIKHAINFYKEKSIQYDYTVLLQPTSPLRRSKHIKEALSLIKPGTEMIVSVKETDANPYYLLFEEDDKGFLQKSKQGNFTRRQDCPKVYEVNGAIYVISVKSLLSKPLAELKKEKYLMDKMSSVDIDDDVDFLLAEALLQKK